VRKVDHLDCQKPKQPYQNGRQNQGPDEARAEMPEGINILLEVGGKLKAAFKDNVFFQAGMIEDGPVNRQVIIGNIDNPPQD